MIADFSQEALARYSKQIILTQVGIEGQRKLKRASALIIGLGGLGCSVSLYLAAAGVGRVGLVDCDQVALSNLQRQILYSTNRVGEGKAEAAKQRLLDLNPHCQIDDYHTTFTSENAKEIAEGYDIIVDGTDNLTTRYLINDLCVLTSKPFVYGAVDQFEGQMALFDSQSGPCYRCVFGDPPAPEHMPLSAEGGVFGVLPGLVGLLQAAETLKFFLEIGESLAGKLVLVNSLDARFEHIALQKNPNCVVCGEDPQIRKLIDYPEDCGLSYTNEPVEQQANYEVTPKELELELKQGDEIHLIDVRSVVESEITHIPGAKNIPYQELIQSIEKLDRKADYVLFCRAGKISAWAQNHLRKFGFRKVRYLKGGINAWAEQVDSGLPKY